MWERRVRLNLAESGERRAAYRRCYRCEEATTCGHGVRARASGHQGGIELQLATNSLGYFELCRLLQERRVASSPARVIYVSSIAARMASIAPQKRNGTGAKYPALLCAWHDQARSDCMHSNPASANAGNGRYLELA
ncbi:MAG: hypothetical protein ACO3JL_14560 [Myxococcota bacterium]